MEVKVKSLDCAREAAQQFIDNMGKGSVLILYRKMGAGKTAFIRAIYECLDVEDVITLPTFVIMNGYYPNKLQDSIYHFNFCRTKKLEEVHDMGYEDYFYSHCLCFLEQPGLMEKLLLKDVVKVTAARQRDGSRLVIFQHGMA